MTIDISQFFQVFFDEAEELLAQMERLLLAAMDRRYRVKVKSRVRDALGMTGAAV